MLKFRQGKSFSDKSTSGLFLKLKERSRYFGNEILHLVDSILFPSIQLAVQEVLYQVSYCFKIFDSARRVIQIK